MATSVITNDGGVREAHCEVFEMTRAYEAIMIAPSLALYIQHCISTRLLSCLRSDGWFE